MTSMAGCAVVTTFHQSSTTLKVAVTLSPATAVLGVPVLPPRVPGAAVSPGMRICSWVAVPGVTRTPVMGYAVRGLLPAWSVAVIVQPTEEIAWKKVRLRLAEPSNRVRGDGRVGFPPLVVIATVGVAVETTFQYWSTALTVTTKTTPATCVLAPDTCGSAESPGAHVWPGSSARSLTAVPGVSVSDATPVTGVPGL